MTTKSPSPNNNPSGNRRPEKSSRLQIWGSRLTILATLIGGGMLINGCAHISGTRPNAEAPSDNHKQTLLKELGVEKDGEQLDGAEVQFGEGATKEEAEANAKAIVEMLIENDLDYKTVYFELSSDKWLACVLGKPIMDAKGLTEKLLKQAGVKGLGEQPGGVEVQQGQGATQTEATDNAMAIIQMLHEGEAEWDYNVQAESLADGTWIAVITARPSSKAFAEEMLIKHFSDDKDFGNQPDDSRLSWGSGKNKKEAENNAKKMSWLMGNKDETFAFSSRSKRMPDGRWVMILKGEKQENVEEEFQTNAEEFAKKMVEVKKFGTQPNDSIVLFGVSTTNKQVEKMPSQLEEIAKNLASELKLTFKYTFQTEQIPDGSGRWITILRGEDGIPEPLDKIDRTDKAGKNLKKTHEMVEGQIAEQQLIQAEEKNVEDGLRLLKGRTNPLKRTELDTPANLRLLAQTFFKKGYFQGTQITIQKMKRGNEHLIIFTLDGRSQKMAKGKSLQEAFESALKSIELNELDSQRIVEYEKRLPETRHIKIPKDITPSLAREWLARMLFDKEFPKGTDVEIEIDSKLNKSGDGLIFSARLTINGKRHGKGESMSGNLAFQNMLEQVEPNELNAEKFEKYKAMLKNLKKFKMPKELRKPIYKKWLARTLADSDYEFNPEMFIDIEKETDDEQVQCNIILKIPEIMVGGSKGKTVHEAFANLTGSAEDETWKPDVKTLTVTTNGRHEVIAKPRNSGEADLIELANKQGIEDMWFYVRHYNGEERFHECGENETREKTDFDIMVLEEVIPKNKIGQLTLYKQHPVDRTGVIDKSQMLNEKDLKTFLFVLEMMKDKNHQLAERMDFRVAVSNGIYRIKFHPAILKNKKLMTLAIHRIHELHEVWLRPDDANLDYEQRERSNFPKTNAEFAKKFSSRLMEVSFEPVAK